MYLFKSGSMCTRYLYLTQHNVSDVFHCELFLETIFSAGAASGDAHRNRCAPSAAGAGRRGSGGAVHSRASRGTGGDDAPIPAEQDESFHDADRSDQPGHSPISQTQASDVSASVVAIAALATAAAMAAALAAIVATAVTALAPAATAVATAATAVAIGGDSCGGGGDRNGAGASTVVLVVVIVVVGD